MQDNPRNLAYTDERLRLHMDLVYYESPPGLQVSFLRHLYVKVFLDDRSGHERSFPIKLACTVSAGRCAVRTRRRNKEMFLASNVCRESTSFADRSTVRA